MATDIMSLFGNYDPEAEARQRRQSFQQSLSQTTDPRQFVALLGTNMGASLGRAATGLLGGPTKEQKIQQVLQQVGNISDPLGQAQAAYELFQKEGMVQEAQKIMGRIQELQKSKQKEQFQNFMTTASVESPEDLLKAARAAYAAGENQTGASLMASYKNAKAAVGKAPDRKQRFEGNDIIYEEWDPTKQMYVEVGRAPRSVAGQKPDMIQNLEYQAKLIGCNLSDPECYAKAEEKVINLKRQDTAESSVIANTFKELETKQLPAARAAEKRVKRIDRGLKILGADGAKPITGAFAEARLTADKVASLFGLSKGAAASATEALTANQLEIAARILASGAFGAGTGISERDLTSAMQMAGADMTLTVGGMVEILKSLRESSISEIEEHNRDIENLSDVVLKRSAYSRSRYLVPVPERLPSIKPLKEMTVEELKNLRDQKLKGKK